MSSLEGRKGKQGTTWRVVYYWNGSKEHVKVGITTKRVAQQRRAQIESLLAMNKNPKLSVKHNSGVSLSELKKTDAEWCSSRKRPRTIKINGWCLDRLISWYGDKRVDEISRTTIEQYMNHLRDEINCNETTVNLQLRTLKAIFQRAVEEHNYLSEHPFRKLKPFASGMKADKPKFLSQDQVKILLESIDNPNFHRLVQFYLLTGCRRTEAIELTWNDIDEQSNVLYLGQFDSQTKLRRSFPLTDEINKLLVEVKEDSEDNELVFWRYSKYPPEISRRFQYIRNHVDGLPKELTTHLLRHTFASHLVMQGIDLTTIASLLGHSTAKITELYAHLQPDHVKNAVEKLPYKVWG